MEKKYKSISLIVILLGNIILLIFFLFTSCDYLTLLSRKEWNDKNNNSSSNIFLYAILNTSVRIYKLNPNSGALTFIKETSIDFGSLASPTSIDAIADKTAITYMYLAVQVRPL